MAKSGHAQTAIKDLQLAKAVAEHKAMFFAEVLGICTLLQQEINVEEHA